MAAWTFDQLRANTAQSKTLSDAEKERIQTEIALTEHLVEALDRLQGVVALSGAASAAVAGLAGAPRGTSLAMKLDPDRVVQRLADLAKQLP